MIPRREFIAGLGSAVALPVVAPAQQPAMPVIGYLSLGGGAVNGGPYGRAFLEGLAKAGYVPGRKVAIEFRGANFQASILPRLAADLVAREVAVIVTAGGPEVAVAAKTATARTPIVFMLDEDPLEYGLVASYNRPGGNVTGVTFFTAELMGKRLNLLLLLVPQATTVGYLCPASDAPIVQARISDMLAAGRALGREIIVLRVRRFDFEAAFATLAEQRVGALIVGNYTFFGTPSNRDKILELAARQNVPAMYTDRRYSGNGGLMSYGVSITEQGRNAGLYTGRILKGEKPADLPVMQPTKFELVINLKTANALGLTIPETLLATADEIIQ
jgi:putative tryptophan/tyrosine transport system substrate-binding protein